MSEFTDGGGDTVGGIECEALDDAEGRRTLTAEVAEGAEGRREPQRRGELAEDGRRFSHAKTRKARRRPRRTTTGTTRFHEIDTRATANDGRGGGPGMSWKPYPAYKDSGVEWLGETPEGVIFNHLPGAGPRQLGLENEQRQKFHAKDEGWR